MKPWRAAGFCVMDVQYVHREGNNGPRATPGLDASDHQDRFTGSPTFELVGWRATLGPRRTPAANATRPAACGLSHPARAAPPTPPQDCALPELGLPCAWRLLLDTSPGGTREIVFKRLIKDADNHVLGVDKARGAARRARPGRCGSS
jgi:hypothetical protein